MSRVRIGVQIQPQHCTWKEFRQAFQEAERLGADVLYTWDHFFPLSGMESGPGSHGSPSKSPHRGDHFEGWTLLTAMGALTSKAEVGLLVGCNSYRNPELVADMARTLDHVTDGRAILGLGAGWFEKDYQEYGYEFGTAPSRLRALGEALPRVEERLGKLSPPPVRQPIPIMIGGGGEKVTLKLTARHAHMWNGFGPPDNFRHKNRVLDEWCEKLGRDPKEIERSVLVSSVDGLDRFVEAGAQQIVVGIDWPLSLDGVEKALKWRDSRG